MQDEYVYSKQYNHKTGNIESLEPFLNDESRAARLYTGDALSIMPLLDAESVDLIFADPPYFLSNNGITCQSGKMVSVNKGKWDESGGLESDFEFTKAWLTECRRLLKQDGSIWISGTMHNIHLIGYVLQYLNYRILNDIVWYKVNPPPNLSCRYFTHATETILWAKKCERAKHKFNYEAMKAENNGRQMQSLWSITPPKPREKRYGKHPTQKPEKLLERIILSSSDTGDMIMDPFAGSGTSGVAAVRLGRRYIGIELEETYLEIAKSRIMDENG